QNVNAKIQDSVTIALYGPNNPRRPIIDDKYAEKVDFEKVKAVYQSRFGDAGDFEFFIVGDVDKETLKPLLEKYIASIPTGNTKEEWTDKSVKQIRNNIDKDIYLKMEDPKSQIRIGYTADYDYNLRNLYIARTLSGILQLRVTETAREDEGGAYSPRGSARLTQKPKGSASINISFDTNPDLAEKLVKLMQAEIKKIADGDIKKEDLEKTLTNFSKSRKENKEKNNYDFSLLQNYVREGYNMNDPKNFEDIISSITAKDVQKFTKKVLKKGESYEIIVKPL
ncbi:MAG: insulinase family protein, partial [Bacteroidota bacterium]